MNDERLKQIMEQVGMPNSRSLLFCLLQVANEVEQDTRNKCANMVDHILIEGGGTYGGLMRWGGK